MYSRISDATVRLLLYGGALALGAVVGNAAHSGYALTRPYPLTAPELLPTRTSEHRVCADSTIFTFSKQRREGLETLGQADSAQTGAAEPSYCADALTSSPNLHRFMTPRQPGR